MIESSDLERLLVEQWHPWSKSAEGEEVTDWLERNEISQDVYDGVAKSVFSIAMEQAAVALQEGEGPKGVNDCLLAGIQLAFFVGFELAKEYRPSSDMSQETQDAEQP